MEPITTTAVCTFLASLATKGLDKAFETSGEKISEGAMSWIKSLFFKEGKPKKVLEDLKESPGDPEKLNMAKAIMDNSIEDDRAREAFIKEILKKTGISSTENTITSSKNVNTGNVNTGGGDFRIGDDYGK